jgi:hypothetical protein
MVVMKSVVMKSPRRDSDNEQTLATFTLLVSIVSIVTTGGFVTYGAAIVWFGSVASGRFSGWRFSGFPRV